MAARYGKRQIFPTPTALPAAASTNPRDPVKPPLFFVFISISSIYLYTNFIYYNVFSKEINFREFLLNKLLSKKVYSQ